MAIRTALGTLLLAPALMGPSLGAVSRIKDIASFDGVRDNQLMGYGLVVGLDGTGDSRQTGFTTQAVSNLLTRSGISIPARSLQISNTAFVVVTAKLPPFMLPGSRIDVTVSSLGDADSLQGGVLMMTPLEAADGQIYAVAQGAVSIGGFSAGTGANSVQKNQPTVGRVPAGALVERGVEAAMDSQRLRLVLHEADFTTASRVAGAINTRLQANLARPLDGRVIEVELPEPWQGRLVEFITSIENERLEVDRRARVVLNEKTGTIIFGEQVQIAPVTIVHGSLTVQIGTDYAVSQPNPLAEGETVVVPQERVEVTEEGGQPLVVGPGTTIEDVVRGLNAIAATPRDVLAIIQAIKAAGALEAELEII